MKTDIARWTFDELNHYLGVSHQMGRLPLESDFNEQNELVLRLFQRVAGDAVHTGSANEGFRVGPRVLLDRLDSRTGWLPTPAAGILFVDYFDHRVGDGSLVARNATAIARTLDTPLDLSSANEILIAVKSVPAAPLVFFVNDGTLTHSFTMNELDADAGWRMLRATPGAWPVGFARDRVVQYGFTGLSAAQRYAFDALFVDTPIRASLVRPELGANFAAAPANAALTAHDDDRLWRSTAVRATGASELTYTLPAPRDAARARKLVVAIQRTPAAAPVTVRLIDDANPAATIDLAGAVVTNVGAWEVHAFALPQAGVFNWSALTAGRRIDAGLRS